jgi:hypothetical protein
MKMVVEPTGCLAFAAACAAGDAIRGKRVGVIVSGGNVDMARYGRSAVGSGRGMTARNDGMHFYEPRLGTGLPHDPFNSIVGPRPIGWISSRGANGGVNLAPYSFFNGFNYTPPIVGFASIGYKDTVRNIQQTREFVWNLATRPLAERMNASCATVPPEVNEFELAA